MRDLRSKSATDHEAPTTLLTCRPAHRHGLVDHSRPESTVRRLLWLFNNSEARQYLQNCTKLARWIYTWPRFIKDLGRSTLHFHFVHSRVGVVRCRGSNPDSSPRPCRLLTSTDLSGLNSLAPVGSALIYARDRPPSRCRRVSYRARACTGTSDPWHIRHLFHLAVISTIWEQCSFDLIMPSGYFRGEY